MVEPGRYRVKKEKKQSRFFLLLSIVLLFVLIKWGLPFFVDILAGKPGQRIEVNEEDSVPPQQPVISALPEVVNVPDITISGYTEALASLELIINNVIVLNGVADNSGAFEFKTTLSKGEHRISVRAKDAADNESESIVKQVVFDPEKLEIIIIDPKDRTEIIGINNKNITIQGKVNKTETIIKVNGGFAVIDTEGNFKQTVSLNEGENQIEITAEDKAGNKAEKTIVLTYYP